MCKWHWISRDLFHFWFFKCEPHIGNKFTKVFIVWENFFDSRDWNFLFALSSFSRACTVDAWCGRKCFFCLFSICQTESEKRKRDCWLLFVRHNKSSVNSPVSIQRCFDVHLTSKTFEKRWINVKTTLYAYWIIDTLCAESFRLKIPFGYVFLRKSILSENDFTLDQ